MTIPTVPGRVSGADTINLRPSKIQSPPASNIETTVSRS